MGIVEFQWRFFFIGILKEPLPAGRFRFYHIYWFPPTPATTWIAIGKFAFATPF